jgi:hypothetical protein
MEHDLQQHSQLFTVRIWMEHLGDGRVEWRGQVQEVLSGEVHYFRDWPRLIAHLEQMLPELEARRAGLDQGPQGP